MLLFLTSIACEVMDRIADGMDRDPHDSKVAFIPTASRPSQNKEGTEKDREKLRSLGFQVTDVDIAATPREDIQRALKRADIIFVGGGNTFYLLQEARRSGFDTMLRESIEAGTPYIGSSAGSVLLGPTVEPIKMMDDPKEAPELDSYDGLGLVDFVPLVHYGNEEFVEEYRTALAGLYAAGPRFVLVRDHEFLTVRGDHWRIDG
ncbi:Type 1 glutamine amidotransferase-like domain-containing protein [Streptomyces sp. JHA26]|uniref:Type 1 glutamine amidotransferase-like domain-containing protein n=1 Tax=Streptomyces sp. JHA26 TaxID=1917143 RepID=UPI00098B4614|nr:Type 1 glutamine amidotransferase-like domain-containing protein [Streptomyces sp. JHA26]